MIEIKKMNEDVIPEIAPLVAQFLDNWLKNKLDS